MLAAAFESGDECSRGHSVECHADNAKRERARNISVPKCPSGNILSVSVHPGSFSHVAGPCRMKDLARHQPGFLAGLGTSTATATRR